MPCREAVRPGHALYGLHELQSETGTPRRGYGGRYRSRALLFGGQELPLQGSETEETRRTGRPDSGAGRYHAQRFGRTGAGTAHRCGSIAQRHAGTDGGLRMRTVRPYRREEEAGRKPRQPAGLGLPHLAQADVRRLREPLFHHEIHLRREPHLLLRQQMREGLLQPRHRSGERAQRIGGEERAPFRQALSRRAPRTHRHTPCPQHVRGLPLLARPPVGGWFRGRSLLPLHLPLLRGRRPLGHVGQHLFPGQTRPQPHLRTRRQGGRPDILSMGGV